MNKFLSNEELLFYLPEFIEIYKKRPIKNNLGGMGFNHSFGLYAILKKLQIKNIYESGVWKGNSTWIIENCFDDFNLVSIDINLSTREYISNSKNVSYYEGDIDEISFNNIDVEKTIVFFDDHTNALERLKFLYSWGIKYAIFEDNYPVGQGDTYSPRKIQNKTGQSISEWFPDYVTPKNKFTSYKTLNKIYKILFGSQDSVPYFFEKYYYDQKKIRKPNFADYDLFNKLVKNYYEIQPLYRYESQRWENSNWSGTYKSLKPIYEDLNLSPFSSDLKRFEQESPYEMYSYTYISLIELNI